MQIRIVKRCVISRCCPLDKLLIVDLDIIMLFVILLIFCLLYSVFHFCLIILHNRKQIKAQALYRRSQARYSVALLLTSATCCGRFLVKYSAYAEYFTCPQGQISLKKAHICLVDKCVLFSGGRWWIRTTEAK